MDAQKARPYSLAIASVLLVSSSTRRGSRRRTCTVAAITSARASVGGCASVSASLSASSAYESARDGLPVTHRTQAR